jgi:hypothetical protein
MSDLTNFQLLETECMKIITSSSKKGNYVSQFEIYNTILQKFDIKDPVEKDRLKFRILMVLRGLSTEYEHVTVINKNDILYISFSSENNDVRTNNVEINNKLFEQDPKETKEINMPTEISVIQFILDQNISDFFYQKDYLGNNVFHYLIINNDFDRISKYYDKLNSLLNDKNNENKTPIDVIKDIQISNFFLKKSMLDIDKLNIKLNEINYSNELLDIKFNDTRNDQKTFNYCIIFLILVYIFTDNLYILNYFD